MLEVLEGHTHTHNTCASFEFGENYCRHVAMCRVKCHNWKNIHSKDTVSSHQTSTPLLSVLECVQTQVGVWLSYTGSSSGETSYEPTATSMFTRCVHERVP